MLRRFATAAVCTVLTAVPQISFNPSEVYVNASERFSGPIVPQKQDDRLLNSTAPIEKATIRNNASQPATPESEETDTQDQDGVEMPRNERVAMSPSASTLTQTVGSWVEKQIGAAADAKLGVSGLSAPEPEITRDLTCFLLKEVAVQYDLPTPLFTRLIWQESRFRPEAVSPVGAKGIAQFMPATAAEWGLKDPFDPIQALPASAAFLRDLMDQFGNFGLAAAAYNGGQGRLGRWLKGKGGLPKETRNYVIQITGRTAEHWARADEATPHPEALEIQDCHVRPLRRAIADIREEERLKREGYPSVASANAARGLEPDGTPMPPKREATMWVALLTGTWSEKKAHSVYASLQKKYPKVLGKRSPKVRVARADGKKAKPKAHVRLVAQTRKEAEELCERLKEAGGACVVKQDT